MRTRLLKLLGICTNSKHADRYRKDYNLVVEGNLKEFLSMTEGMITFDEASLLYTMAKAVHEGSIIEVGSYRGRSTVALARGSLEGARVPVYAIEPHEPFEGVLGGRFGPADRGAFFKAMLDTSAYHVVRLINLSSEAVCGTWRSPVALLWIDGDHSYAGVKRDFEAWEPHLMPGACIAFDDTVDEEIGPYRVIAELTERGRYVIRQRVGKVTVIARRADADGH